MNENQSIRVTDNDLLEIITKLCDDARKDDPVNGSYMVRQIATCNLYMASVRLLLEKQLHYSTLDWRVVHDSTDIIYTKGFAKNSDDLLVGLYFDPKKCELYIMYRNIPMYHVDVDRHGKINIMDININNELPIDDTVDFVRRVVNKAKYNIENITGANMGDIINEFNDQK